MAARHFLNPVSISRKVMEDSDHCALCADGALEFAKNKGFDTCNPEDLIEEETSSVRVNFADFVKGFYGKKCVWQQERNIYDTVSAVALDSNGHFACATSTGGIPGKLKGRVGDAPLVGCGGYANEFGAATTSGHGEALMKMTLAREVVYNMERGQNAQESSKNAVQRMKDRVTDGYGCTIAIDRDGNFGKATNSVAMLWATIKDTELDYGMERKETITFEEA